MPGPRPTPTATLAARGSWRAAKRTDEPKPPTLDTAEPPKELAGRAAEIWRALAPRLVASAILTTADVHSFNRYVRLYAAWEQAMNAVDENSDRSAVLTLAKLDSMVAKLEQRFGLTPADRTGLKVEQPQENAKERFFKKAG